MELHNRVLGNDALGAGRDSSKDVVSVVVSDARAQVCADRHGEDQESRRANADSKMEIDPGRCRPLGTDIDGIGYIYNWTWGLTNPQCTKGHRNS